MKLVFEKATICGMCVNCDKIEDYDMDGYDENGCPRNELDISYECSDTGETINYHDPACSGFDSKTESRKFTISYRYMGDDVSIAVFLLKSGTVWLFGGNSKTDSFLKTSTSKQYEEIELGHLIEKGFRLSSDEFETWASVFEKADLTILPGLLSDITAIADMSEC